MKKSLHLDVKKLKLHQPHKNGIDQYQPHKSPVGVWMGGWVGWCESSFKDFLQQPTNRQSSLAVEPRYNKRINPLLMF